MMKLGEFFFTTLTFLVPCAFVYWAATNGWIAEWLRDVPEPSGGDLPPITFLRPVKRDAPRLEENFGHLVRAMRDGDQLVFGVDPGSETALRCAEMRARFPKRDIVIVGCAPGAALNPKISKLVQMTPHALHGHWVLSDSEAMLDADFLGAFRREWLASGADALTAGYRFAQLDTWPRQLDAAATLLTLWPGLSVVRSFGRVRLTLGACTAFRRADIESVGGWAAFADDIAEDNRLGVALADAGRTVRLSAHVVTLASDALTWRDYWRHQRRVAVTYRVANPAGFAASILTHGLPLSLLALLVAHAIGPSRGALLFFTAWTMRWATARAAARLLAFPIPRLMCVVLLASFVETACWIASWFSGRVWWGGRWWSVSARGKLRA